MSCRLVVTLILQHLRSELRAAHVGEAREHVEPLLRALANYQSLPFFQAFFLQAHLRVSHNCQCDPFQLWHSQYTSSCLPICRISTVCVMRIGRIALYRSDWTTSCVPTEVERAAKFSMPAQGLSPGSLGEYVADAYAD